MNGAGDIFQGNLEPIQFRGALWQSVDSASYNDWASLNHAELNPIVNAVGEIVIWPHESRKLSVSSRTSGQLDVFDVGSNRQLRQKIWNGSSWSGWIYHGGTLTSAPSVASRQVGHLDVFVRGQDHAIYYKYLNSTGWHGFYTLGGVLTSSPASTASSSSGVDLVALGTNRHIYERHYNGYNWSGWDDIED